MSYEYTAIPDAEVPRAVEPAFQHAVTTYASEVNKTAAVWRAVPEALLDFRPHPKTNPVRTILVHQLLSERRFFAEFAGLSEPPVEDLLPPGERPAVQAYVERYVELARRRLPQFARGTMALVTPRSLAPRSCGSTPRRGCTVPSSDSSPMSSVSSARMRGWLTCCGARALPSTWSSGPAAMLLLAWAGERFKQETRSCRNSLMRITFDDLTLKSLCNHRG